MEKKLFGFILKRKNEIDELACSIYEYEHESTGARLVYLDRDDENKTFAIGFRTPPEDSTGVFHIIEHSVLCGSEKFPVKEPFVELLKSSLNTFLNALTYPDKTVYPVASRCERDYLNLIEVYLDAVFFPLARSDKRIFMQEGVHLEYDRDGDSLSYNGVVYNEMKGAYSSPEEAGFPELDAMLWEGSPYGFDSGGSPDNIPDLTYEKFVSMHEKYYHPSNSVTVLDGKQDLAKVLPLIDSYFSRFSRKNIEFSKSNFTKSIKPIKEIRYDASDTDGESSKTRLLLASSFAPKRDKHAKVVAAILCDFLAGNNDSPLKQALIQSGLCEDVNLSLAEGELCSVTVEYRGIRREDVERIVEATREAVQGILDVGVPREKITAMLNMLEFKAREADYGSRPRGVSLALSAIKNIFDGCPAEDDMSVISCYSGVRELLLGDYYEKLLSRMLIDVDHSAGVLLIPDENYGEELLRRERERLSAARLGLDGLAIENIVSECEAMRERQESEDSPEAIATLPRLTLDDVPTESDFVSVDECNIGGVRVLSPKVKTNGIVYARLYFDISDFTPRELTMATLLSALMLSVPTENYSLLDLTDEIRSSLGSLTVAARKIALVDGSGGARPYFTVSVSALAERYTDIPRLLGEVLLRSDLSDRERQITILKQVIMYAEEAFISGGDSLALDTASACTSIAGVIGDHLGGHPSYVRLKEFLKLLSSDADAFISELSALAKRMISSDRLILSVCGMDERVLADEIIKILPRGEMGKPYGHTVDGERYVGYAIPSRVSYAVTGAFSPKACGMIGPLRVARHILSYEYLWNNVRVLGGAYGAGFVARKTGEMLYYSYRDPSPKASLECYKNAPDALREIVNGREDLTDFIIGAVGEYDILLSPKMKMAIATENKLSGWTCEMERALRRDMIGADKAALLRVCDLLSEAQQNGVNVVVGPDSSLSLVAGVCDNVKRI